MSLSISFSLLTLRACKAILTPLLLTWLEFVPVRFSLLSVVIYSAKHSTKIRMIKQTNRENWGNIASKLVEPNLAQIQIDSYKQFLEDGIRESFSN